MKKTILVMLMTFVIIVTVAPVTSDSVYDVAVTNVVPSVSEAYPTWTIQVIVTAMNKGIAPASFNVTAYYNASTWYEIGTQNVTDLPPGNQTTLTFNWTLAGLPENTTYTVKANATLVGDINPDNDERVAYDAVKIRVWGDVNGDGKVGLADVGTLELIYSLIITEPYSGSTIFYYDGNWTTGWLHGRLATVDAPALGAEYVSPGPYPYEFNLSEPLHVYLQIQHDLWSPGAEENYLTIYLDGVPVLEADTTGLAWYPGGDGIDLIDLGTVPTGTHFINMSATFGNYYAMDWFKVLESGPLMPDITGDGKVGLADVGTLELIYSGML